MKRATILGTGIAYELHGKDGDPAKPTGRTRQLQYKLAKGEASWVLKLDRMVEF